MSSAMVEIHELIAWDLDEYPYRCSAGAIPQEQLREAVEQARQRLAQRKGYEAGSALLEAETSRLQSLLAVHAQQEELRREYAGLDWTLGIVDLHQVLAFQRRLVFDARFEHSPLPKQEDWNGLLSFSFGGARSIEYTVIPHQNAGQSSEFSLQSGNPDLQLRMTEGVQPLMLYGGSPFFEIAEFRGRWFLRDGYHRAYRLLRAGIHHLPAVVIRARTIDEVGATQLWFFEEEQLFSSRPPRVMDFLEEDLVIRYQRPRFRKTIRISIEESLLPENNIDEVQGDLG